METKFDQETKQPTPITATTNMISMRSQNVQSFDFNGKNIINWSTHFSIKKIRATHFSFKETRLFSRIHRHKRN